MRNAPADMWAAFGQVPVGAAAPSQSGAWWLSPALWALVALAALILFAQA